MDRQKIARGSKALLQEVLGSIGNNMRYGFWVFVWDSILYILYVLYLSDISGMHTIYMLLTYTVFHIQTFFFERRGREIHWQCRVYFCLHHHVCLFILFCVVCICMWALKALIKIHHIRSPRLSHIRSLARCQHRKNIKICERDYVYTGIHRYISWYNV